MAVNLSQARRSTRNQCAEYGVVDVLGLESIALEQEVFAINDRWSSSISLRLLHLKMSPRQEHFALPAGLCRVREGF